MVGLASKSKTHIEEIVGDKLYQEVCDKLLTSHIDFWLSKERHTAKGKPQLNNTITFSTGPGSRGQGLHRDNPCHHCVIDQKHALEYTIGQETDIGYFIAGKQTTKQDGATRFIPGSHLWGPDSAPDEKLAFYAELEAGDAFIMLSSCYHGGSANMAESEERLAFTAAS